MEKLIIQLLTIVTSYLIPLLISCILSILLICIKKRKFDNKVSVVKEPEEEPTRGNLIKIVLKNLNQSLNFLIVSYLIQYKCLGIRTSMDT